jgi:hypothetical protein
MTGNCRLGGCVPLPLSSLQQAGQAGQRGEGRAKELWSRILGVVGDAPLRAPVWRGQWGQGHVTGATRLKAPRAQHHSGCHPASW